MRAKIFFPDKDIRRRSAGPVDAILVPELVERHVYHVVVILRPAKELADFDHVSALQYVISRV